MIILEKYQLFEKLLGLRPLGGRKNIFLRIAYSVTFTTFFLMELIFFILNIRDGISQAAVALAPICGVPPGIASYAQLLIARKRYLSILSEFQGIVNESKQLGLSTVHSLLRFHNFRNEN